MKDPGNSKSFPFDSSLFASTVHPLLTAHCTGCHIELLATPQAPFFANADPDSAYEAAKSKIDLDSPSNSRLVVRLRDEFHNCWSGDCRNDAAVMEAAINDFADLVPTTQVDPRLVASKALVLPDGIIASGGSRHEANIIALWEIKTGNGITAYDTSGVEPGLHLALSGDYDWVGGYGIALSTGKAQGTTSASKKLHDLIKATGENSIEAWVVPANVTQERPARIVSYSGGTESRNFTLGRIFYSYDFLHRRSTTGRNGDPAVSTADADEDLQAPLQHVVATFDPANRRRIYVNGTFTEETNTVAGGNLSDWDDTFAFLLGNEVSSDRQWQGTAATAAAVMKMVIDGFAGAGTISMCGYDYHTGDRATGELRDLRAGRCMGACLVLFTGDSLGPERHQQIGYFRPDGSVETASSPAANNVHLLVETVILNYMALHGEQCSFSALFPNHGLGNTTMLDSLTAFDPIVSGTT